jgi:hypothetical protein
MTSVFVRSSLVRSALALVAVPALAIAMPNALHAQEFEGAITMHAAGTTREGQPLPDLEYLARGGKMRINVRSPMGTLAMIAVPAEKKMYTLLDAQRMYMEMPLSLDVSTNTNAGPAPVVTRTGRKETIAGYECEHITVVAKDTTDVCMARGLGPFFLANLGMNQQAPAWQKQLAADRAFPLKVVGRGGKTEFEVTKIERRKLSDAMFDVPDSYAKMEMPTRRPPARP